MDGPREDPGERRRRRALIHSDRWQEEVAGSRGWQDVEGVRRRRVEGGNRR